MTTTRMFYVDMTIHELVDLIHTPGFAVLFGVFALIGYAVGRCR